jgi:uncharacterized protein YjbI with pentapeptide repeats/beta-lactamase regulating signal transducer with metallopeptidase domain
MNLPFVVLVALIASVVASGVLTAGVFGLLRVRAFDATTRHGLWFATLIAVALLPIAGIGMSVAHAVRVSSIAQGESHRTSSSNFATSGRRTSENPKQAELRPVSAQRSAGQSLGAATNGAHERASSVPRIGASPLARLSPVSSNAALAVLAALLAIALLGIIWLAISVVRIGAVKRRSSPLDETLAHDLPWLTQTHEGRETYLRLSYEIEAPMAIGFTRPVILIPTELATHSGLTGIEDLVIHEHAHLVRYDDYTNLVQRAIERIFWFNPFVWVIGRRIALEREIAADDAVVARTADRTRYAESLWRLAREMRLPAYTLVAPGALFTRKQISVRIEALLAPGRAHLQRLGPASAAIVAIVGLVAYGLVALAAPPLELPAPPQPPALPAIAAKPAPLAPQIAKPAPVKQPAPHAVPSVAAKTVSNAVEEQRVAAERHEVDALRNKLARANAQIQERKAAPPAVPVAVPPVNVKVPHVIVKTPDVHIQNTPNINVKAPAVILNIPGVHVNVPGVNVHVPALSVHVPQTSLNLPKHVAMGVDREQIAAATPLTRQLLEHCTGCDLSHRDLRNLDLHGISFSGVDLTGADLRGANLSNADLTGADLRDANLDGANLTNTRFSGADISGASFRGAKMDGVRFTGISLRHSAFDNTNIRQILLHGCSGCDLSHMDLHGIDLHGLRMDGSDLSHSDLNGANLSGTRFSGVSFDNANLDHADLRNAELSGCSLDGASLNGAQLEGIRLTGTSLGRKS